MKRILLTIVAIAAITLSTAAQGLQDIQSTSWYGGPSKSYVDRATLDERAQNYHFIINEANGATKRYGVPEGKRGGRGQLSDWGPPQGRQEGMVFIQRRCPLHGLL